jgi:hypothetical protein
MKTSHEAAAAGRQAGRQAGKQEEEEEVSWRGENDSQ